MTSLPAPNSGRAENDRHSAADLAEVVRLHTLRLWIEQSYKQVKNSLGWAHYQVRKDLSIRRHWQLVCCAFTFCWWNCAEFLEDEAPPGVVPGTQEEDIHRSSATSQAERGKRSDKNRRLPVCWPETLRKVRAWLEPYVMLRRYWKAYSDKDPPEGLRKLLECLFRGEGLYLYVH